MTTPREALTAIGLLPDAEIDIAGAALQLARIDAPGADWEGARRHLSDLARESVALAGWVPEGDIASRAVALARIISGRYGYLGDVQSYDDLANANLIRVIQRRRGLPVAIGIIWLHCARAAGWPAHGVDFPGHFLVALEVGSAKVVLDVFFGGAALDTSDLSELLQRSGQDGTLRPGLLKPMSTRAVLVRLQNNIKLRRLAAGDVAGGLTCIEDTLRIAPEAGLLWREAALLNQRLGRLAPALRCFEQYLALAPQGESAARARAAVEQLRARLG
ncbi:MAG: transglutaminase family protein [Acetobacteraceae bacterium]|nr:transglutaminase family protein [Acetobacteraceae bacterium]